MKVGAVQPAATALAALIERLPRQQPPEALTRAREAVLDTLGVALAGAREEPSRAVAHAVSAWGNGPATILHGPAHAAPPWAALANGTAAHALDYDDYDTAAIAHGSAVTVPALIALAEALDSTLDALLDAYIIAFEVLTRIGDAINPDHYRRGWHSTSTIGAIAAAAGCARLLRLDTSAMASAISLGASMAAGTRGQLGFDAKPIHAGLAAKNGVVAASLAAVGITAAPSILEGPQGFGALYSGFDSLTFPPATFDDGPLSLVTRGLVVKRFPACGSTLRAVDALLILRNRHGILPEQVKTIVASLPLTQARNLRYAEPVTQSQAKFSLQWCFALALSFGTLRLADFRSDVLIRPELRSLLPLTSIEPRPDSEGASGSQARVVVHLTNGARFEASVVDAIGTPANPLSREDLYSKFRDCTATAGLSQPASERLAMLLLGEDGAVRVRTLLQPQWEDEPQAAA